MYDDTIFYAPSDHPVKYAEWTTKINTHQTDLNFQEWMAEAVIEMPGEQ